VFPTVNVPGLGLVEKTEILYYNNCVRVWIARTSRDDYFLVYNASNLDTLAVKLDSLQVLDKTTEQLFYTKLVLYIKSFWNAPTETKWLYASDLPGGLLGDKKEIFLSE
jgi:hypothetical protein